MPLVLEACLAYAAGLLVGLGGVVVPGAAACAAGVGVALVRRDARLAGLALLAAAAALAGDGARRQDQRCRIALVRAGHAQALLLEDARGGVAVAARLALGECRVAARLLVRGGTGRAGERVALRGAIAVGARGAVVRDALLGAAAPGRDPIVAAKARAGRTVARLWGRDAALPQALLLADMREIPAAMRDRFAMAGLVHALSVSGLHVGLVALAAELLLQVLRLPRRPAAAASLALVAGYVLLLGAPAPALRSALMLGVGSASRLAQRPTSAWTAVALGAWGPILLDPRTVLDLGYQLSVGGVATLGASASLVRRLAWLEALGGWRGKLARELLTSTVATAVTAPLVAAGIGRLSLVGPFSNIVAAPVIALLQPALFLALALAPLDGAAALAADATRPLLLAFDLVARAFAAIPGASLDVAPSAGVALLAGAAAVAALVACVAARPGRPLVVGATALVAAAWLPLVPHRARGVELHMLDVGQGDAIALRSPRGRWVLFDAGGAWRGGDAGRQTVVPYLRARGGALAALVLSHPHTDHVGGAATVVRALRPAELWDPAYVSGAPAYRAVLDAAREGGTRWRRVHPGDLLDVDGVRVRFLAPDSAWASGLDDPNLASTIALVEYGTVRFLLVGDAEEPEERWLLTQAASLRADVLKVGHHGSRTSSSVAFIDAVRPRVGLVSVGSGNVYRLPNADVLDRLLARGAEVLRTDELGAIVVRSDGARLEVEANGATWELSSGG